MLSTDIDSSRRMEKYLITFPQASYGMILGRQEKKFLKDGAS